MVFTIMILIGLFFYVVQHIHVHYEILDCYTAEVYNPSLSKWTKKQKTLSFVASIQHVRNVNNVKSVGCGGISTRKKKKLERKLNTCSFDFSCGASTTDLDLSNELDDVHLRDLRCEDPVDKLYNYSRGYEQICIYCSSEDDVDIPEKRYPICASCSSLKSPISKQYVFSVLILPSYHSISFSFVLCALLACILMFILHSQLVL